MYIEEIIKMEQESVVKDAGVPETTIGAKGSRAISEEKNPTTEEVFEHSRQFPLDNSFYYLSGILMGK